MLGLDPAGFWSMTLGEFEAALEAYADHHGGGAGLAGTPPTRVELEEMMARFPD